MGDEGGILRGFAIKLRRGIKLLVFGGGLHRRRLRKGANRFRLRVRWIRRSASGATLLLKSSMEIFNLSLEVAFVLLEVCLLPFKVGLRGPGHRGRLTEGGLSEMDETGVTWDEMKRAL